MSIPRYIDALLEGPIVFTITASNGFNSVTMTVCSIAELNEAYQMLRFSACFEDAYFIVQHDDGRTIYDRNFGGIGGPDWWIGAGDDPASYVKLISANPRQPAAPWRA